MGAAVVAGLPIAALSWSSQCGSCWRCPQVPRANKLFKSGAVSGHVAQQHSRTHKVRPFTSALASCKRPQHAAAEDHLCPSTTPSLLPLLLLAAWQRGPQFESFPYCDIAVVDSASAAHGCTHKGLEWRLVLVLVLML